MLRVVTYILIRGTCNMLSRIILSRNVLHAMIDLFIEDHVTRCDGCMDIYDYYGSQIEKQQACITRKNMHHHTKHCISLHMFIIYELVSVFQWNFCLMKFIVCVIDM